jgi:NAD dependent epimerase/dehydratase family enzyme
MSWIAHDELPFVVRHVIATESLTGAVNVVAPAPARNAEFTQVLARVLHRPAFVPVPAAALQLLYGQMASDTILGSQRAAPDALQRSGYAFRYAALADALEHQLAR